jgi:hypothetical protein
MALSSTWGAKYPFTRIKEVQASSTSLWTSTQFVHDLAEADHSKATLA